MKRSLGRTGSRQGDHLAIRITGLVGNGHNGPAVVEKGDSVERRRGIGWVGAIQKFLQIVHAVAVEVAGGILIEVPKIRQLPGIGHAHAPAVYVKLGYEAGDGTRRVGKHDGVGTFVGEADVVEQQCVARGTGQIGSVEAPLIYHPAHVRRHHDE